MTSPPTRQIPDPRAGYLLTIHVAQLWSEVETEKKGEPVTISEATVLSYVKESRAGGRYEKRPMPLPAGYVGAVDGNISGRPPYWQPAPGETLATLEKRLREWKQVQPGPGGGPGRPPKHRELAPDGKQVRR